MIEVVKDSPKPHAYLVAGGGGGMRSTIILRMLARELGNRGIPYTPIEGINGVGDSQKVWHPSLQVRDMNASIRRHPEGTPLLFVSHCIGTVAALASLESYADDHPVGLVSVAPPLPSPRSTIMTPQSRKKRSQGDTLMRVVDLPEGAVDYTVMTESVAQISPEYFADIHAADDLQERLRAQIEAGRASIFAPEHDWNTESPETVATWHDEWRSKLPDNEFEVLRRRANVVDNAAHGLYISPRSGLDVSTEEDLQFQMNNVRQVIDTGLGLLANPEANSKF